MYLVAGEPGTGKTTLGMEFLRAGLDGGEDVLFIHGEESKRSILANSAEFGIDLAGADFLDIGPESEFFAGSNSYDIVDPQTVEDDHVIEDIREAIERLDPGRALIDPISQLQYLEPSEYQFRKRIIAFMRFLRDRGTTVYATTTPGTHLDVQLDSLSDGVIRLEHEKRRRRIRVPKHRGVGQQDGTHGLEIRDTGIEVFPSLVPKNHERTFDPTKFTTGVEAFDDLLGGGIERGTVTIISGPTGVGKSTTATMFLRNAAESGDGALAYLFEESMETFSYRSESLGLPVERLRDSGDLTVEDVNPLTLSPEEFARRVQYQVEQQDAQLVLIDGIEGYKTAIKADERPLRRKLHALTRYLTNMNVTVILIDEISEVTEMGSPTSSNVSYIADNILFEKYVELDGHLRRVAGVLKKRVGRFEETPKEFTIGPGGIDVERTLTNVRGVLDGRPELTDDRSTD